MAEEMEIVLLSWVEIGVRRRGGEVERTRRVKTEVLLLRKAGNEGKNV